MVIVIVLRDATSCLLKPAACAHPASWLIAVCEDRVR
jgi:hypothetical protein